MVFMRETDERKRGRHSHKGSLPRIGVNVLRKAQNDSQPCGCTQKHDQLCNLHCACYLGVQQALLLPATAGRHSHTVTHEPACFRVCQCSPAATMRNCRCDRYSCTLTACLGRRVLHDQRASRCVDEAWKASM